jgi:hypothetical protein
MMIHPAVEVGMIHRLSRNKSGVMIQDCIFYIWSLNIYSYYRWIYMLSYPIATIQQACKITVHCSYRDSITHILTTPYFEPAHQAYNWSIHFMLHICQELFNFFNFAEVYPYIYRNIWISQVIEVTILYCKTIFLIIVEILINQDAWLPR